MKPEPDDIIIHPGKGEHEQGIPAKGLFFVNPAEAKTAIHHVLQAGGVQRVLFHSGLAVSCKDDFFVAGPALGAPMAVMTMEKLIALGAERVIMSGWCGAVNQKLKVGDCVFGGNAYSGEGTSRYYVEERCIEPSVSLVHTLQTGLSTSCVSSTVWSTDAPYRESRTMLNELAYKYGVSVVDMEYSALCSVATFRKIDFAAVFLVSDELWQKDWHPGFGGKSFKKKSKLLIKNLIEFMSL